MNSVRLLVEGFLSETPLHASERKEIPTELFGIPETRSYPLHDAEHVRKAIQMFAKAPADKKRELAKRILAQAKTFGIHVSGDSLVAKAA